MLATVGAHWRRRWWAAAAAVVLALTVTDPASAIVPAHSINGAERSYAGDVLTLDASDVSGGSGVGVYTPEAGPVVTITFDCVVVKGLDIWGGNLVPVTEDFGLLSGQGDDGHRYYIGVETSTAAFPYRYSLTVDSPGGNGPCGAPYGEPGYPDWPTVATHGAFYITPFDPL